MSDAVRQHKERFFWDRSAARYDKQVQSMYSTTYDRSIGKARGIAKRSDKALDMACGAGILSLAIAPSVERVVGTDISPRMIAVAQEKAHLAPSGNAQFRVADGYSLPYEDEAFDVVLLFNVLHTVLQPETMLRESHRLLKRGGLMASATDCYGDPMSKGWQLQRLAMQILHYVGVFPYVSRYRKEDIVSLFERCGFSIRETDTLFAEPVNYYVLAERA